ncbi:MAG: adenosylcobinamide-phosphate synthase CbiB [Erysipelotrichales bacterium]
METFLLYNFISLNIAFILDLIIGDPNYGFHPIILLGKLNRKLEKILYKDNKLNGFILGIVSILISMSIVLAILYLSYQINIYLYLIISTIITYQIIATKSLYQAGQRVYLALEENNLDKAREAVGMIVGRTTTELSEEEVINACIESVIENTSDGVSAPLMYLAIGSTTLGMGYKASNTLDSMFGYKNEKYQNFGYFSAKFDDIINYIPARLSALIMILASALLRYDYKEAFKVFKRDRYNHLSPNAGQLESVSAGALNIQLGGDHEYFGVMVSKPTIGNKTKKCNKDDIKKANNLMLVTSILTLLFIDLIYILIKVGYYGI